MSLILARKLDDGDNGPERGNRQFVEFGGAWYKVWSMCHGTKQCLLAALGEGRMDGVIEAERFDIVAFIDHHHVNPLVVRDVTQLDTFRALQGAAEA